MFEQMFVCFAIEMSVRFSNQPVLPNLPHFIAADANFMAGTSEPSVGSDERPMIFRPIIFDMEEMVEDHLQIGKARHKSLSLGGDGLAPNGGSATIHGEGTVQRIKRRHG